MDKVVSLEELLSSLSKYKECENLFKDRRSVTLANGVFDILHVGHIRYFKDAKSHKGNLIEGGNPEQYLDYEFNFNILIVGINSDESVKRIRGTSPIINQNERAEIIASLDCVDYVVIFDEDSPAELIRQIKPNFHAKGKDYDVSNPPEKEAIDEVGSRFITCGDEKNHSSTAIKLLLKGENENE